MQEQNLKQKVLFKNFLNIWLVRVPVKHKIINYLLTFRLTIYVLLSIWKGFTPCLKKKVI